MANKKPMKKTTDYTTLHDIFLLKLKAIYDVELTLEKALQKTAKRATHPDLKKGLESHLEETKGHIKKVEQVFALLGEKPKKVVVEGIRGIIADIDWVLGERMDAKLKTVALIGALQYVEHYEIAGYGTLITWAKKMGHTKEAGILKEMLAEEKVADAKLTALGAGAMQDVPLMTE